MLGAIVGDIVGSTRKWYDIETENFRLIPKESRLVPKGSRFTGVTVMTLAVAEWLMTDPEHRPETLVACMQRLGRKYPDAGYGEMFSRWLESDNPKPYNSFGNGSAVRVSPVGLYAGSLEEALELARITASVSHDHPEGIKGAQAIAGCVYLNRIRNVLSMEDIRHFITKEMGYGLNFKLEDICDVYGFDETCQGCVPIAIMAYLEHVHGVAEMALQHAISVGGDFNTIAAMTASIVNAEGLGVIRGGRFDEELIAGCRALLPADLLDINDRFEKFICRPLPQSHYVCNNLFAGEYPGDKYGEWDETKLKRMYDFGVRYFVDLSEEGKLRPYCQLLRGDASYWRIPIKNVYESVEAIHQLIEEIDEEEQSFNGYTYMYCWGNEECPDLIEVAYVLRHRESSIREKVLANICGYYSKKPKALLRKFHVTQGLDFLRRFVDSCEQREEYLRLRTRDRIRGSLMAGAAGDALGYAVEFMSRNNILAKYGNKGITKFDLTADGKALVSDDTQMTLFTASGMLLGETRVCVRGIGGSIEMYIAEAYLDWYYTQTGKKEGRPVTWLRDLPEMAHRRAPGNTCLSACESLYRGEEVQNNSKGCGGIMRVAPVALREASRWDPLWRRFDFQLVGTGAKVAAITHKHPLAFLPAAMLMHLILKVITTGEVVVKANIANIAFETIEALDMVYDGKYEEDKRYLANLTKVAVKLAANDKSDAENIRSLGEGWTGEEAWAIALYCVVRHVDSVEDAIIAAVNHDGDSDSTGAICGNIMGAIYGYEAIKRMRLFCPQGRELEQTLELSNIILAIADDLYTGCIINGYRDDTPRERQWSERYMK